MNIVNTLNNLAIEKRAEFVKYCLEFIRKDVERKLTVKNIEFSSGNVAIVRNDLVVDEKYNSVFRSYTPDAIKSLKSWLANELISEPDVAKSVDFKQIPGNMHDADYIKLSYYFAINIK